MLTAYIVLVSVILVGGFIAIGFGYDDPQPKPTRRPGTWE